MHKSHAIRLLEFWWIKYATVFLFFVAKHIFLVQVFWQSGVLCFSRKPRNSPEFMEIIDFRTG